ncbi:MAG: prepilin peptidase [Planctomycetes bacterium]|nr:prepilin peptidase [Planctomycetota bacterium]
MSIQKNFLDVVDPGLLSLIFIVGLIVGSFLNVCIYRIPRKKSLISPRSFCPSCNTPIGWYANVPVLSYIFLLGRCRICKAKIPIRYPLVELLTGYVFVHLYYVFIQYRQESPCIFICYLALCCALIISTFVDLELLIIPNEVTFVGIPLALVLSVICPGLHNAHDTLRNFSLTGICRLDTLIASMIGMLTGGGLIFLCSILGKWVFKKDAMGFGDVKLMCMIGGVTGWKLAVSVFFVAPFFGLLMAVPVLLVKKSHLIPYGPFLSLATLVCILMQDYFIGLVNVYVQLFVVLFSGFHS